MKKETIKYYTILYQYLLLLKQPLYIFITEILQHLSPMNWWEDYINPAIDYRNKENFLYLDFADLINILQFNWKVINQYLDKDNYAFVYDDRFKVVEKVHGIRTTVAHANDVAMTAKYLSESLENLLKFAYYINARQDIILKLETDWAKYKNIATPSKDKAYLLEEKKGKILDLIEAEVLFPALICDSLKPDVKASIIRTTMRLKSMRTIDEITGFFFGALQSERGKVVSDELHKNGLKCFEDIKETVGEAGRM